MENVKKLLISTEMGGSDDSDDDHDALEYNAEKREHVQEESSRFEGLNDQESEEEEIKPVACKKKKMTNPS